MVRWPRILVDRPWDEGADPVEHITMYRLELADLGDESSGFRMVYVHGNDTEPAHDESIALVRLGEVLLWVSVVDYDLIEPYDQSVLEAVAAKAVSRAEAAFGEV